MPVIVVWAILCAVLAAYVVYRFVTDRADGSAPHPLFPFVSRSTDGTLPPQGAWLEWIAYVCFGIVFCSLLASLASETGLTSVSLSGKVAGGALLLGLSLLALAKQRSKRK